MKAYEIIDAPEKWTKNALARDADGNPVHEKNLCAVSWCVVGAICKVYGDIHEAYDLCNRVETHVGEHIVNWNNALERTHDEVIKVLKELDI